jgi:hypothetical protein
MYKFEILMYKNIKYFYIKILIYKNILYININD